ncbi:MAG: hypothetical protein ACP5LW_04245 [Nitrososphaeria archaeon]
MSIGTRSLESEIDKAAGKLAEKATSRRFFIESIKTLDGIAASSILYKTFVELGGKVIVRFTHGDSVSGSVPECDYRIAIGKSGQNADLVIGYEGGITPSNFGYDDLFDGSLSSMAQLIRDKVSKAPEETYFVAIAGSLSAMQDVQEDRKLKGINQMIIERALKSRRIQEETRLELPFGDIVPLRDSISMSYDPYFKGITGSPAVASSVVASTGIQQIKEGRFVTLKDLKEDELDALEKVLLRYSSSKLLRRTSYKRSDVDDSSYDYNLRDILFMLEPLAVKNESMRIFKILSDPAKGFGSELFYESLEETEKLITLFNSLLNVRDRFTDEGIIRRIVGTGISDLQQLLFFYKLVYRWDDTRGKVLIAETNEGPEEAFVLLDRSELRESIISSAKKHGGRVIRLRPFIIIYVNVIKAGLLYEEIRKMIAGVP